MLFSSTIQNLEKGLDYAALTQKTIAQNIANVDTPNYKSKAVSFQDVFNEAKTKQLEAYRTDERHIPFARSGELSSIHTHMKAYRHTGNGVDMDKEQANMAENQIYYNALIDRLNGKFNSLQQVIKGGR